MERTPLENWIIDKTRIKEENAKALEAYQLKKLRETLNYAKKNSLFYREKLKNVVVDIKALEDLQNIPFTYPEDIRENSYEFLCVPQHKVKRIVTLNTSGTSGEEKRIFFTEEDLNLTIDFFKYGMRSLVDHRDRVLVLLPGNSYGSIGDLLKKALEESSIECIVGGILVDIEEVVRYIEEKKITCIVGIPMQILYLSRVRSDVFKKYIKKVLLSTDYVPEVLKNELTHKYACSVFTHYGMTEMGYGGGVECKALKGYHMREGDLYFEIINPNNGKAIKKGEYGELVFTTLTRQAMPLIRYRTGDIAAISQNPCACKTFLSAIKKVLGRKDNGVLLRENQFLYLRELDEIILNFEDILDYKAYIDDKGRLLLEIKTQNEDIFNKIKDKVVSSVQNILDHKLECKFNIEVIVKQQNKLVKIKNSMIKRKIYDYRNAKKINYLFQEGI